MRSVIFAFKCLGISPIFSVVIFSLYIFCIFIKNTGEDLKKLEDKSRIIKAKRIIEEEQEIVNIDNTKNLFK